MHSHSHDSAQGHSHSPQDFGRAFAVGIILNGGFVLCEFVFGLMSHSLALTADAGHNLSDVLGLLMAWGAATLARRPATDRYTYGFRRTTILAALTNAVLLFMSVGVITWEAIQRLFHPEPVVAQTVMIVAGIGIIINTATALMFMRGSENDINLRGAFLHMAADALVSVGVVVAAGIIWLTGWQWLDSIVSLAIVAIIVVGTWGLFRDSVLLSLDAVPPHILLTDVESYLADVPGVAGVHDLHIWAMSTTEAALTAHLRVGEMDEQSHDALLAMVENGLHDRFGIEHSTLQIERTDRNHGCCLDVSV